MSVKYIKGLSYKKTDETMKLRQSFGYMYVYVGFLGKK